MKTLATILIEPYPGLTDLVRDLLTPEGAGCPGGAGDRGSEGRNSEARVLGASHVCRGGMANKALNRPYAES